MSTVNVRTTAEKKRKRKREKRRGGEKNVGAAKQVVSLLFFSRARIYGRLQLSRINWQRSRLSRLQVGRSDSGSY